MGNAELTDAIVGIADRFRLVTTANRVEAFRLALELFVVDEGCELGDEDKRTLASSIAEMLNPMCHRVSIRFSSIPTKEGV